jgi:hypothetical protein
MRTSVACLIEIAATSAAAEVLEETHLRLIRPLAPIADQLEIVRAAGRWYVFWGERGHAIRAWF